MAKEFSVRKGLLKPVEFKGLRSQYIVIAGAGTLIGMIVSLVASIVVGLAIIVASIAVSIFLNGKYGANGLALARAKRGCASYIVSGKRLYKMIGNNGKRSQIL
jgi:hypothetical protein